MTNTENSAGTLSAGSCWDERVQQIYQNEPPSKEPRNIRISLYDRDPSNINELVKVSQNLMIRNIEDFSLFVFLLGEVGWRVGEITNCLYIVRLLNGNLIVTFFF
jgi:hypothetical protein